MITKTLFDHLNNKGFTLNNFKKKLGTKRFNEFKKLHKTMHTALKASIRNNNINVNVAVKALVMGKDKNDKKNPRLFGRNDNYSFYKDTKGKEILQITNDTIKDKDKKFFKKVKIIIQKLEDPFSGPKLLESLTKV